MNTKDQALCGLCGEPMPEGEHMFKYHGYSGPCPKPTLKRGQVDPAGVQKEPLSVLEREALRLLGTVQMLDGSELVKLPMEVRMDIDAVLMVASVRRLGA